MMGLAVHRCGIGPASGGGLLLADMVAHWDLSEASGTRSDSHGGLNLTSVNSVGSGPGVDGVSTAAEFVHGSNQYLTTADAPGLRIDDAHWVMNLWIRRTSASASFIRFGGKGLVPTASGGEMGFGYPNNPAGNTQQEYFDVRNAANSGRAVVSSTAFTNANTWYMLTLAHDPDANLIRYYINGAAAGTAALTGGAYGTTGALYLGGSPVTTVAYVSCRMQCVSIWKGAGALAALSEMAWLYNSGAGARTYSDIAGYSP